MIAVATASVSVESVHAAKPTLPGGNSPPVAPRVDLISTDLKLI